MDKYYRLLNVSRDADLNDIKKAYRHAVHLYHPDANGGVGNPEKFKEVVKAYKYLQQHHKTFAIKPRRNFFGSFAGSVRNVFAQKRRSAATKDEGPKRRSPRHDEFLNLDPLLLKMPFSELRVRFCRSENEFVKRQSARALTSVYGSGAFQLLKQELETCSVGVGEEIIFCLGLIGDREAISVIERYVRHSNVKLACASVKALKTIDRGYARTILEKMEREGMAFRHFALHYVENMKLMPLVRKGVVLNSELYLARFLRVSTRQPLPVILEEMGFIVSR